MYEMKERRSMVYEMKFWVIVLENTKDKTKFYHSCNYVPSRYIGCAYKYSTEKGAKIALGHVRKNYTEPNLKLHVERFSNVN